LAQAIWAHAPRPWAPNVQPSPPMAGETGPGVPFGARVVADPLGEAKPPGWTRFVCFSDTHGRHDRIPAEHLPAADVLLHAGDFTNTGETSQVKSFAEWLRNYPAVHKVVIAGNHDVTFQPDYYEKAWSRYHLTPLDCQEARQALIGSGSCTYLEDQLAEVLGYRIYGSPWQPEFCDWAFNLPRGAGCREAWDRIPEDVDVLMTHGPPFGIGDLCEHGGRAGCEDLLSAIKRRAVPVSVAGHIHEAYGTESDGTTLFVNASTCTFQYRPSNPPIVLDLPPAAELREQASQRRAKLADLAAFHAELTGRSQAVAETV